MTLKQKYFQHIKEIIFQTLKGENCKVILFGSRARGDHFNTSDVDIGIIPLDQSNFNELKLSLLREKLEESTIPYKVDVINMAEVEKPFYDEVMKDAIPWTS